MSKMPDNRLVALYLSGECSEHEKKNIEQWLESNPDHQQLFNYMRKIWQPTVDQPPQHYLETSVQKTLARISEYENAPKNSHSVAEKKVSTKVYHMHRNRVSKYAAAVFIAVTLSVIYMIISKNFVSVKQPIAMKEVHVEFGKQARIILTDGTRIILDAGSELSFPEKFTGETRDVFLNGEGYFEVAPDVEKSFRVYANHAVIKVLGTKFNVRAWRQNHKVKISVTEGKVLFYPKNVVEEKSVPLPMGYISTLYENKSNPTIQKFKPDDQLGWLSRRMKFKDAPLFEVLDQLGRWYNISYQLPDPSYKTVLININIEPKPVKDIIDAIALALNLEYNISEKRIYFSIKK